VEIRLITKLKCDDVIDKLPVFYYCAILVKRSKQGKYNE